MTDTKKQRERHSYMGTEREDNTEEEPEGDRDKHRKRRDVQREKDAKKHTERRRAEIRIGNRTEIECKR